MAMTSAYYLWIIALLLTAIVQVSVSDDPQSADNS